VITAVICTNRFSGGTPVFIGSAFSGVVALGENAAKDITIDYRSRSISSSWGGLRAMTQDEAKLFGADFGAWFSS
jgi:hypothetical protein